jgi:peptidoglycan hydrolase-like protein with peptidoglycan-binding domain
MVARVFAAILAVLLGTGWAFGQATETPAKPAAKPAAEKSKPKPKPRTAAKPKPAVVPRADAPASGNAPDAEDTKPDTSTAKSGVKDSYAAVPMAERLSIQSDLVWTGDYNGLINGEFSDRLVAAVKAFQRRNKSKDTGVLNPQERAILAASAKPLQDEVGWRLVEDQVSGARLGLPGKLATETSRGASGTRWTSALGQLQIETFRIANARLEAVFDRQKR